MIDIVFQSGEFYNESSIWQLVLGPLATLIAVIISGFWGIYLFNKGIKKDRTLANEQRQRDYEYNTKLEIERRVNKEKENEKNRIENLKKFGHLFQTLLSSCILNSENQVEKYEEYVKKTEADILGQHFPQLYTHENLHRLLKLNESILLEYIEHINHSNKEFVKLLTSLDYLKIIFETIAEDVNEGNNKISLELRNRLIFVRNNILTIATEYLKQEKETNPNYEKDSLYIFINSMVLDYLKGNDGNPNPNIDYKNLILVIKEELLKEQYRMFPICIELIDLAKQGGDIVFSIKQINELFLSDMTIAIERIKKSIETLRIFQLTK